MPLMQDMKRVSKLINTVLMGFVILMMGVCRRYGVTYMVYHSIPTVAAYIFFYYLIYKNLLDIYVWALYATITIYMIAATICLGFYSGYNLYCLSLIPLTFYMDYLAHKLHTRKTRAIPMSLALICAYLGCTAYAVLHGPIYEVDKMVLFTCLVGNALGVFGFLVGYSSLMQKLVLDTESKLSDMAHTDQLTKLFNRRYMTTHLDALTQDVSPEEWIAMVDIDNFKGINDRYGHACGDYVLAELSRIMQEVCHDCVISRWGGEEFLIAPYGRAQDAALVEKLRQTVADERFSYQGKDFSVTVTIGISYYQQGQSLDKWLQSVDDKLYQGKNSGKNRVIY